METQRNRHLGKDVVVVLALVGVGFLLAWVRFRPYLGTEGQYTDGIASYDVTEVGSVRYAIWEAPESLGAEVATADDEGRATVTPDGRQLVFAVGQRGQGADLWTCDLIDGVPHGARPLRALNTPSDELAPCFGPGGLYFASDRPGTHGGLDLWRAPFDGFDFGEPELLGGDLASAADDTDPAPLPGGGLAFASNRDGGRLEQFDLFLARPNPSEPGAFLVEPLAPLNTGFDEREPAVAGDGRVLFFASDREGGQGSFDLYRSGLDLDGWSTPQALENLNGPGADRAPAPSVDGFTLVYSSEFEGSGADLMRATSRELFRREGDPVGLKELLLLVLLLLLALLAWGAKRWRGLDVVYRCFLISLLLHLLLLWWFREVYPESKELELAAREDGVKVRLVTRSDGAREGNAERAGELAVERSRAEAAGEPQRAAAETSALAAAAPSAASLSRRAAELGAEPVRVAAEAERQAQSTADRAQVAAPREEFSQRSGAAEALALAASEGPAAQRVEPAAPSGEAILAGLAAAAAVPSARPSSAAIARPRGADLGAAPERRSAEAERVQDGRPAPEVAVASLEETFVRRADAGSGEVALEASSQVASASRGAVAAPARREVAEPGGFASPLPGFQASAELAGGGDDGATSMRAAIDVQRSDSASQDVTVALPDDASELVPRATGGGEAAPELVAMSFESARREVDSGPSRSATIGDDLSPLVSATASPARAARLDAPAAIPIPRRGLPDLPARHSQSTEVAVAVAAPDDGGRPDTGVAAAVEASAPASAGSSAALALVPTNRVAERAGTLELPRRRGSDLDLPSTAPTGPRLPDLGGLAAADTDAPRRRWEHTPYASRSGAAKVRALDLLGGSQETEAAVASGLAYLARIQARGGWWGSEDDYDRKYHHVVIGKTGLCLLAFLGAEHTADSASEHSDVVRRGIDFLLGVQDERSGHFGDCTSYGHGIATYALAEAYAMTGEERLRRPLERAVAHIVAEQNRRDDDRLRGGWSYYYPDGSTFDRWPRVSISVWQIMALESARFGGIEVDDEVLDLAKGFVERAWDSERGAYRYSHDPSRLRQTYAILPGSTPAALFALSLFDEDISSREYREAREFISEKAPRGYRHTGTDDFVYRARGNLYFWYYGSLALLRAGGDDWRRWNEAMKETLLPSQNPDGSWEPISSYADYAGDDSRDKSYSTAMCVLTLEVYYRYFTPLLSQGEGPGAAPPAGSRGR
ncbi:PD40 domain-containing protein [Engelhardtia mirabilis]|uniref:WD40-like Beta Propeller Repeat protein n=1 Tax=Engelhardtia mirabilis TaxID=2528011 RepID=A0A518BG89_9BACT|nr:WD40-like Beta Propeller Repeat protein [Planctomycetes bacterium Pla133]QDV00315.1 WD40-like Beta Propeller Repeat protein [Planctomycetes bacterium Pla86]